MPMTQYDIMSQCHIKEQQKQNKYYSSIVVSVGTLVYSWYL